MKKVVCLECLDDQLYDNCDGCLYWINQYNRIVDNHLERRLICDECNKFFFLSSVTNHISNRSPFQSPLQSPHRSPLQSPRQNSHVFNYFPCLACQEDIANQEAHTCE